MLQIEIYENEKSSLRIESATNIEFNKNNKTLSFQSAEAEYSIHGAKYKNKQWLFSNVELESVSESAITLSSIVIHSGVGKGPNKINILLRC